MILLPFAFSITAWRGFSPSARASTDLPSGEDVSYVLLPGGVLHSAGRGGLTALPIGAGVGLFAVNGDAVYYVRGENGNTIAGRWKRGDAAPIELPLPADASTPRRLRGSEKTLYALYGDDEKAGGTLYSVDFNERRVLERGEVVDFTVYLGRPVLIERADGELRCVLGEVRIPLLLSAGARFLDGPDPRMLFVTDGGHTEIIDAVTEKTIYRYADGVVYRTPGGHNLEIEAIDDTPGPPSGRMLFYKVYINGVEAGRTDTGPAETRRVFRHSVAAGEYLVVTAERWELNIRRERYERANNIMQPEPQRLYVPEGLILRVLLASDGRTYRITAAPVVENAHQ